MKNILSYKAGSVFSGQEINDWIKYQIDNNTSHAREAYRLNHHYTFQDDKQYEYVLAWGKYQFERVDKIKNF